jgi:nucleotide-binding universal stress UspA family protein
MATNVTEPLPIEDLREVIVALDRYERSAVVLDVAAAVARRAGVPVRLVTVASASMDHMRDKQELHDLAAGVDAPEVGSEVIESNDVVAALLEAAGSDGLLCVETRARGPIGAIVLGSTASKLLEDTLRPVLLVGPATKPQPSLDVMEVCFDGPDVAAALVPAAAAWSRRLGCALRLVHAWVPGHERFSSFADAHDALDRAARRLIDEFAIEAGTELLQDHLVPEAIVGDAERHGASVIAVAMRARSPLYRLVFGSTAMAIAHATSASVLAVPCVAPHR